jgi:hypothetical protein
MVPNPEYEDLVAAGTRSEGLSNVSPENGALLEPSGVRFHWKTKAQGMLSLELFDNKGNVVHRAPVGTLPLVVGRRLSRGLYYWKVMSAEEALHFGKFMVK